MQVTSKLVLLSLFLFYFWDGHIIEGSVGIVCGLVWTVDLIYSGGPCWTILEQFIFTRNQHSDMYKVIIPCQCILLELLVYGICHRP